MALTIKQRILEKINDIPTEGSLDELTSFLNSFNNNLWKVANLLPPEELMTRSRTPDIVTTPNSTIEDKDMADRIILRVDKLDKVTDGDNPTYRPVTEIEEHQSHKTKETGSIYEASAYSPVYWFESTHDSSTEAKTIQFHPDITDEEDQVKIYTYKKQVWDYTTEDFDLDTSTKIRMFPNKAEEAVILLTAVDLLKNLMALRAIEDEDADVVQMITAQIQSLEASMNKEMEFIRPDIKGPEGAR